jgi:hypothetical protein
LFGPRIGTHWKRRNRPAKTTTARNYFSAGQPLRERSRSATRPRVEIFQERSTPRSDERANRSAAGRSPPPSDCAARSCSPSARDRGGGPPGHGLAGASLVVIEPEPASFDLRLDLHFPSPCLVLVSGLTGKGEIERRKPPRLEIIFRPGSRCASARRRRRGRGCRPWVVSRNSRRFALPRAAHSADRGGWQREA